MSVLPIYHRTRKKARTHHITNGCILSLTHSLARSAFLFIRRRVITTMLFIEGNRNIGAMTPSSFRHIHALSLNKTYGIG